MLVENNNDNDNAADIQLYIKRLNIIFTKYYMRSDYCRSRNSIKYKINEIIINDYENKNKYMQALVVLKYKLNDFDLKIGNDGLVQYKQFCYVC